MASLRPRHSFPVSDQRDYQPLARVVEMTSYHVGLREHIETLFAVHREFVTEPYPAWTAVGVTELLNKDAVLEIAVTAVRRP
jgi:enamine deaminase RidA (YjgF/YER057c/UK114 family)